jgi:phage gp46-like protein
MQATDRAGATGIRAGSRAAAILRAWWSDWHSSVIVGATAFLVFRVVTEVVAMLSLYGTHALQIVQQSPGSLFAVWNRWDTGWYLDIARMGYAGSSHVLVAPGVYQDGAAFSPLYPALVRGTTDALRVGPETAAALVGGVALVFALIGMHKLAHRELGSRGAILALILLLAFPASFFLSALYPEPLLLACLVWCFLAARTRHWWAATFFAGAAVLTKTYTIVLIVPLAIEYMSARSWSLRRVRADAVAVVAGPALAAATLVLYMQVRLGDGLRFLHAEAGWGHELSGPWTSVSNAVSNVGDSAMPFNARLLAGFDVAAPFALATAAVYLWRKGWRSYAAFTMLAALVFVLSGVVRSDGRYALTVFPIFIAAAMLLRKHPAITAAAVTGSCVLGGYFLHEFANNHFAG